MTGEAVALAGHFTAQGALDSGDRLTLWLQGTQAIAAVATTIGVLTALYVAVVREPRKAADARRRHEAQMDVIRHERRRRLAAQARKIVPSCLRTPMIGESWWTVRIDNTSKAATTILAVDVAAIDTNGIQVHDGYRQVDNTAPVDEAFNRSIRAALSGSLGGGQLVQQRSGRLSPTLKRALQDAVVGHLATGWRRILPPNQHTAMAYTTTSPEYTLRVTVDYEDEAGYQWRRTDIGQPMRIDRGTD